MTTSPPTRFSTILTDVTNAQQHGHHFDLVTLSGRCG